MRQLIYRIHRGLIGLGGPTPTANRRRMRTRGESLGDLTMRAATPADIGRLAELHVITWNAAYAGILRNGPSVAVRAHQWREAFANQDGSWFALILERADGEFIGFAKGIPSDDALFPGELSKIYFLREYQRLGLGRVLIGEVARRFLAQGIRAMRVYVEPRNPSCGFYEAIGGVHPCGADGRVNHEWYVWPDIRPLANFPRTIE